MRRVLILVAGICLLFAIAPAVASAGIVQGHVYAYDGSPVAGAFVGAYALNDQGEAIWEWPAMADASGAFAISGAPATNHGMLIVSPDSEAGPTFVKSDLTFVDPGTTSVDIRPGAVTWSALRGGPWATDWQDVVVYVSGLSETGAFVEATTPVEGAGADSTVTGSAFAMPADVRRVVLQFAPNEVGVWDAADPGNLPVPVLAGSTTALPFTIDEATARRIYFTNSYWRSGKPGTVLRLAMENFPAGTTLGFMCEAPNVFTRWGGKSYTSTGPELQTVDLTVPAKTWPGYAVYIGASEATAPGTESVGLSESFQTCTLNASRASIPSGSTVKLSGVVPVEGHWYSHPGRPKYVWIYKRTTAQSAPPTAWDATTAGWKLVARLRTDGLGRYHSGLLTPRRTTWYVVRYAGDAEYWRAYTSLRKVRVY